MSVALVALIIIGGFILTHVVDAQRFKPQIAAAVRAATGRELQLRGPLELSWFPWLALQARDGALADDSSLSGAPPLLSWRELRIGARALPLLNGELSLDRIQIVGAQVHLRRSAAGVGNWQSLLDKLRAPGDSNFALSRIAGVSMRDATLDYMDGDSRVELARLRLDTSDIETNKPIALRTAFDLLSAGGRSVPIEFSSTLQLSGDALTLSKLQGNAIWSAASGASQRPRPIVLSARALTANLAAQLWQVPAATLSIGDAALQLTNTRLQIGAAGTAASAGFGLAPTSLRALLLGLGIEAPATRDAKALQRVTMQGSVEYSTVGFNVSLKALQLDDTQFSGRLQWLAAQNVSEFALDGDHMDLDRYRGPVGVVSEPFKFPTQQLAALRARGVVTLQQAQAAGADMRGVTLRLLLADGKLQGDAAK